MFIKMKLMIIIVEIRMMIKCCSVNPFFLGITLD